MLTVRTNPNSIPLSGSTPRLIGLYSELKIPPRSRYCGNQVCSFGVILLKNKPITNILTLAEN